MQPPPFPTPRSRRRADDAPFPSSGKPDEKRSSETRLTERMARNPLVRLQDFALTQHGHVSVAQAVSADLTLDDLYRLTKQRALVRVHLGVYRLASAPMTFKGRAIAAVLAGGEGAVASYSWAARLWGATRIPVTEQPEITRPGVSPPRIPGVTVHSSRELEGGDVTEVEAVPVTSGARTAIDLAHSRLNVATTMALVDDLIAMKATTRAWQYRRAQHLIKGRAGVEIISRITRPGAEEDFWSWLERYFDNHVVIAFGLPRPSYNVAVHDQWGRIGIADAVWRLNREVVTEVDGLAFHDLPADRRRDSQKTNRYTLSGRIPLRFTYEDIIRTPAKVADQIRRALDAAGH